MSVIKNNIKNLLTFIQIKFWFWYPGFLISIFLLLFILLSSENFFSLKFIYEF